MKMERTELANSCLTEISIVVQILDCSSSHADAHGGSDELHDCGTKDFTEQQKKCRNTNREKKTGRMASIDTIPVGQSGEKSSLFPWLPW